MQPRLVAQQISKYERGEDRVSKGRYDEIVEILTGKPPVGLEERLAAYLVPPQDIVTATELSRIVAEFSDCLERLRILAAR